MKAEHRHELKTNDLAKSLLTFGDYARVYGGRVALGVAIVILVIVLIVQRSGRSRDAQAALSGKLASARQQIDKLSNVPMDFLGRPTVLPNDREVEDARKDINTVKQDASTKVLQAEALIAEGDLNWALSNYPDVPAASATQPVPVNPAQRAEYARNAKTAYETVLSQYADQTLAATSARFGLAALAENAKDWSEARKQYEAVKSSTEAGSMYNVLADSRQKTLEKVQKPLLVGVVAEKEEEPKFSTDPATTRSTTTQSTTTRTTTTAPATGPATMMPATKPAMAPKPATTKASATTKPVGK